MARPGLDAAKKKNVKQFLLSGVRTGELGALLETLPEEGSGTSTCSGEHLYFKAQNYVENGKIHYIRIFPGSRYRNLNDG